MTAPNLENVNPSDTPGDNTNNDPPPVPFWQNAIFEERQNRLRSEAELRQAREELARMRSSAPPTNLLEEGDVFKDPEKLMSRIQGEIQRSVAPLNSFISEFTRKDRYNALKVDAKSRMNQQQLFIFSQVEPYMDRQFYNNPQLQPDPDTFNTVFQNVVGFITTNGGFRAPDNTSPRPNISSNNNPPVIPPTVRPHPAPAGTVSNFDESSFTENERRLARENHMSLQEYAELRDAPPHESEKVWRGILERRKNGGTK